MKIGVVGQGFVGGTMTTCLRETHTVETYDKFDATKSTVDSIRELCSKAKTVFVCVPTPMRMRDGSCDVSIVGDVVQEIADADRNNIVVIRSTVPPGTTASFNRQHPKIDVIFNPEFLREASPVEDFMNQTRIVLGGDLGKELLSHNKGPLAMVSWIYREAFPGVPILTANHTTAEMIKYTTNVYLATKVSLANELKQVCNAVGVNYDDMIRKAQFDERLGASHWQAPGPDGNYGFGGHCLPKDLKALTYVAKEHGIDPKVMEAVWDKNYELRSLRDWEEMKGRAVVD